MALLTKMLNLNLDRTLLNAIIPLLLVAGPALADKQDARDWYTGCSVLGAAGLITPEPITTALGSGALVGQGTGFIGMGIWDFFTEAPANPDPNHEQVARLNPPYLPVQFIAVVGIGPVYDAVNASIDSAAVMIDSSRILQVSLSRYYGAIQDANDINEELQHDAASAALVQLESDIGQYRSDLLTLSSVAQGTGFAALSTTAQDVVDLRDQIVLDGSFPSYENFVFEQIGATAEEMTLAIAEVELMTGNSLTNADLTGAALFGRLEEALGEVNIRELLPPDFEPSTSNPSVPLLSTSGMVILLGCIFLSAFVITRIRRVSGAQ